jgi:hypothetical protein
VLVACLEARGIALLRRHFPRFETSVKNVIKGLVKSDRHRVLLGMLATVLAFWADIASDVPVLIESWQRKGTVFYVLLVLMFGSHILDANTSSKICC